MKLNQLLENANATVYGFPAFKGLESFNDPTKEGSVIISTDMVGAMASKNVMNYYCPVLPMGARYNDTEEVINADLDCNFVHLKMTTDITPEDEVVFVSNREETTKILQKIYPKSKVLTGQVTIDDIKGLDVVGLLPAHLAQHCNRFKSVVVKNFDAVYDDNLTAEELQDRLVITDTVKVTID